MESVWGNIISVLFVFALAIVSPGPNFILVVNASLTRSRGDGLSTAAGVAFGSALFAVFGLFGLMLLIEKIPYFHNVVRYLGSAYLVWLGLKMTVSRTGPPAAADGSGDGRGKGHALSFVQGLATNMTNPKAWAFYIGLFALFGHPDFPDWARVLLCVLIFLMALLWYGSITMMIANVHFRRKFSALQSGLSLTFGAILIAFAVKIWLSF